MYKKKIIFALCLYTLFMDAFLISQSAITYQKPRGRLGDQLFCYCKAKWISYQYNIPVYYKEFKYSNELFLSVVDEAFEKKELNHLRLKELKGYKKNFEHIYIDCNFSNDNYLYVIDQCYYPEIWRKLGAEIRANVIHPYEITYSHNYINKGINNPKPRHDEMILGFKRDKQFIEVLQNVIRPLSELKKINKPEGILSVAVHVRKGGGFDKPYKSDQEYKTSLKVDRYTDFMVNGSNPVYQFLSAQRAENSFNVPKDYSIFKEKYTDIIQPLKHPPDQFYIDQIKGLSAMLGNVALYVYIFTDDQSPLDIVKKFKRAINNKNIIFACREAGNNYYSNVLDDLFSMSAFDYLIRPYSSLSQTAQLIGNHKIVLSPYHGIWCDNKLIIDEVLIMHNKDYNF